MPSLIDLGKFALFAGLTVVAAWIAGTGRVAYVLVMLVIAAALVLTELQADTLALAPSGPNVDRARRWVDDVIAVLRAHAVDGRLR